MTQKQYIENKTYCMSKFLVFRNININEDNNYTFSSEIIPKSFSYLKERQEVYNSEELEECLRKEVQQITNSKKTALALSGGIDSAILAKYMPKNSKSYTFKCVVPNIEVTDESKIAKKYAKECNIDNEIIEIFWEDFNNYAPILMQHKGMPIHSIEIQIYKLALQAKKDGIEALIFGESADVNFGGLDNLLSRNYNCIEFVERYAYILPYKILKKSELDLTVFLKYIDNNGNINVHNFLRNVFYQEAIASYTNACTCAGIELIMPYASTYMGVPLDYSKVRAGRNKYWVREIFEKNYPNFTAPPKLPMPRATNEWLQNWKGPTREEFLPNCIYNLTGDQKWLVYCLEQFLNQFNL
ncbi:hypothetical protein AN639_06785 [Candidatus Epulonipiscium fishelsonii]|uniref:Uncharacterized protein n=1 Tax=Candidatus Epulonipiscium fishelsonii TaxID=77094 RepID=A0ACC8X8A2_9FIRM|nr:hypothetical protein AN396_12200 [Epulopiscium sp. SCG-B11WGA-EpuloA1]ONI39034.1 hypothetical protein AN639_06785 [Epulopiscium sp. SCG-B05WGA-EpuloA1]